MAERIIVSVGSAPLIGIRFRDWRALRTKVAPIPVRHRRRVWHILFQSLLNEAMYLEESRQLNAAIESQVVPPPLIVLGLARSGTTLLHQLFAQDPRLASCTFNQAFGPHTFLLREGLCHGRVASTLRAFNDLWTRWLYGRYMLGSRPRGFDSVLVGLDTPEEDEWALVMSACSHVLGLWFPDPPFATSLKESDRQTWQGHWHRFLKKLTLRYDSRRLVLKSPGHMGRLPWILELFPDAKFIFIHREPTEVFRSFSRTLKWMNSSFSFHETKMDFAQTCLRSGRMRTERFFSDRQLIPEGNLHYVGYKDLVANPLRTLEDAYKALDLGDFLVCRDQIQAELEARRNYQVNTHPPLEPDLAEQLRREWNAYYTEFGY